MVGAARRELLHVRREQDARNVLVMGAELGDGHQVGSFVVLDKVPDKDISLDIMLAQSGSKLDLPFGTHGCVCGAKHATIASNGHA